MSDFCLRTAHLALRLLSEAKVRDLCSDKPVSSDGGKIGSVLPFIVMDAALRARDHGIAWFWCAPRLFVDIRTGLPLGSGCFMHTQEPNQMEIGYGTGEQFCNKGVATWGVGMMCCTAFAFDPCKDIVAKTSQTNPVSGRVLSNNGFSATGNIEDPHDGPLIVWKRSSRRG